MLGVGSMYEAKIMTCPLLVPNLISGILTYFRWVRACVHTHTHHEWDIKKIKLHNTWHFSGFIPKSPKVTCFSFSFFKSLRTSLKSTDLNILGSKCSSEFVSGSRFWWQVWTAIKIDILKLGPRRVTWKYHPVICHY